MEEEDVRREAAIASSPSLQPNFKSPGVTKGQLSKFQELHKKRMQIKKKSGQKRWKDETRKFQKQPNSKNSIDKDTLVEDSSVSNSSLNSKEDSSVEQQDMQQQITLMKRQKLHWGRDGKGNPTCRVILPAECRSKQASAKALKSVAWMIKRKANKKWSSRSSLHSMRTSGSATALRSLSQVPKYLYAQSA